jgi:hypothetical protein
LSHNLVGKISAHFKNTPCISYFIKCTPRLTLRPFPERIGHDRAIHQKQRLRKAHRELEDRPRRRQEEHSPPGKQLPRRIRPLLTTRQQRHVHGTHQQNHGQICQTTPLSLSNSSAFLQYFTPRDQVITQRLYRPHNCSPACKDYVRHNLGKLRGHNPLSKPLLCGWARITQKVKGRKEIVYKAPCSRILRNMQEVHRYLRMTKSEMTVDLFDFNHMVRCLAEFNVECIPDPKDLSKGTAALTWGLSFLLSCFKA